MAWPTNWATGEVITEARLTQWTDAIQEWGGSVDANFNTLRNIQRAFLMDGSDGAPSGTFENAQTTGWKLAAANTLGIVTNGTERMRFDGSGNINFGANGSELVKIYSSGSIGFGTTGTPGKKWHFHKASADDHLYLSSVSPSFRFGNHETFASRTLEAVLAMPTVVDNFFSGTVAGDAVIYTAGPNGGTAGRIVLAPSQTIANALIMTNAGLVGLKTVPATLLHLGGADAVMTIEQTSNAPADPSDGQTRVYVKDEKYIIQYRDGAVTKWRYLHLNDTTITWVYTTVAP